MSQGSSHAEFLEEPTTAWSLVLLARGLGLQGEVLVEKKGGGRAPEDANGKTWDFYIFKYKLCPVSREGQCLTSPLGLKFQPLLPFI